MRRTTEEQEGQFMQILIEMGMNKEDTIALTAFMDTPEKMDAILQIFEEHNYEMTSQEIFNAGGQIVKKYG